MKVAFKILVILAFLLLFALIAKAQCSDSIIVTKVNGCKRVSVTEALFVDLFVAKRTLDTVHVNLKRLEKLNDSIRAKQLIDKAQTKSMTLDYQKQIKALKEKDTLCQHSLMVDKQYISDVEKSNDALGKRVAKLENNRWKHIAIGGAGVGLGYVIAKGVILFLVPR